MAGRAVYWIRTSHDIRIATISQSIHTNSVDQNQSDLRERSISTEPSALPISFPNASAAENNVNPAALSTRVLCWLPTSAEYRAQWEEIGITLVDPLDSRFLTLCLLPEDWKLRNNPSMYCERRNFTLLDNEGIPRANMFIIRDFYDVANVSFISKEQGILQLEEERKATDNAKKAREATENKLKNVLSQRSESWSVGCPYGVFFIKDMNEFVLSGYTTESTIHSCHGFFPSEEIANTAIELLSETADYKDRVFMQKVTNAGDVQKASQYKIANGFSDSTWFGRY